MRRAPLGALRPQRGPNAGRRAESRSAAEHDGVSARDADPERPPRPAAELLQLVAGMHGAPFEPKTILPM